ncbi:hypothetical protein NXV81_23370 [Bacteroides ovatus]|nr:hypothetical protein [Bacteroides ovatus]
MLTANGETYDTSVLTTADDVLALYGYSIKVELSDKVNFEFDANKKLKLTTVGKAFEGSCARFGSDGYYYSFNQLERNISCTCGEDSNIPYCSLCGLI